MEILKLLEGSPVVKSYQVLDFKALEEGWYFKIKVDLTDGSVLHAREYTAPSERKYSFHWQDAQSNLRIRWDNAPHYDHLPTHPHHKHVGQDVQPSKKISLRDVLEYIEHRLT